MDKTNRDKTTADSRPTWYRPEHPSWKLASGEGQLLFDKDLFRGDIRRLITWLNEKDSVYVDN
jgi:hypothetical protein